VPASLYVAIYYAPSQLELAHWAMFVEDDDNRGEMVLQVIGGDGEDFEFDARETNPIKSKSFSSMTLISNKLTEDLETIYEILQSTTIHNDNACFNCQEWVLAGLEDLTVLMSSQLKSLNRPKSRLKNLEGNQVLYTL
jgi:hypothetical protein